MIELINGQKQQINEEFYVEKLFNKQIDKLMWEQKQNVYKEVNK